MSYDVMVRCPKLNEAVPTGIRCAIEEFIKLPANPAIRVLGVRR